MAKEGAVFRDMVKQLIESWDNGNIECLIETNLGMRFDKTPRRIDIAVHHKITNKFLGIECKIQRVGGTAYQKLTYALQDCIASPIPTILVYAGRGIRSDFRTELILSGKAIELGFTVDFTQKDEPLTSVIDPQNILRQRVYMELGLNWFPYATFDTLSEDDYGDAYYCTAKTVAEKEKLRKHLEKKGLTTATNL